MDHRDDSTFSFDPSVLNVKKLNKNNKKKIDSRKGVLLASYSKKKTRRKKVKGGKDGANNNNDSNGNGQVNSDNFFATHFLYLHIHISNSQSKSRSVTPSPGPSPRHSNAERPKQLQLQLTTIPQQQQQQQQLLPTPIAQQQQQLNESQQQTQPTPQALTPKEAQTARTRICFQEDGNKNPNMLYPSDYKGQLLPGSRQASSNSSGVNRESSQDDSGVVDDHEEQEAGTEMVNVSTVELPNELTSVTLALSPREVRLIKCNGNIARIKKHNIYALHQEFSSEIVVIGE